MKKFWIILIPIMIIGCGVPYKSAVYRQLQTSRHLNDSVNDLGSAMSQGVQLDEPASKEIRDVLDEQHIQRKIAAYALEQYMITHGVTGYAPVETELNKLHNANAAIADVVHKWVGNK